MTEEPIAGRLYEIKIALEDLEREIAQREIPRQALTDFKIAVDHVRLSVWAILSAEQPHEIRGLPPEEASKMIAHFRLSRAIQLLRHIQSDIEVGVTTTNAPDIHELRSTLEETARRVAGLTGGP